MTSLPLIFLDGPTPFVYEIRQFYRRAAETQIDQNRTEDRRIFDEKLELRLAAQRQKDRAVFEAQRQKDRAVYQEKDVEIDRLVEKTIEMLDAQEAKLTCMREEQCAAKDSMIQELTQLVSVKDDTIGALMNERMALLKRIRDYEQDEKKQEQTENHEEQRGAEETEQPRAKRHKSHQASKPAVADTHALKHEAQDLKVFLLPPRRIRAVVRDPSDLHLSPAEFRLIQEDMQKERKKRALVR